MQRWTFQERALELVQGDITDQTVDAIVNAANRHLAGGGGVDGAIHRRGGPQIMQETRRRYPAGCPTGDAVISSAGNLNCRYVIHAVGPYWQGGQAGEAELLSSAYRRCLQLAAEHQCDSISLPSLSTGAYRYPMDQAADIALEACVEFLRKHPTLRLIRFVLFDSTSLETFANALQLSTCGPLSSAMDDGG